jgi:2-dehydro-3-deoxyphosphogluconate aldolase/(4S)-4-hydroxy-2-oxoglutarate aldolase
VSDVPTRNCDLTLAAVTDRITGTGVLPVIVIDDLAHARPLAQALVDSGLHVAEVTFRTPQALDALSVFAGHPELLVGAGTVRTADQVRRAQDAGARFVVSPGFSEAVVEACRAEEVPVFPGVSSATDIHHATEAGLDVLKFFPAEASGGAAAIAALSAPFPDVRFVPTGGVGPGNLADYLRLPAVSCVGGSWMVPREAMRAGDWSSVTELCREAVAQVARLRGSGR